MSKAKRRTTSGGFWRLDCRVDSEVTGDRGAGM
jgi:hypothetical protein